MKFLYLLAIWISPAVFAQTGISGVWQGLLLTNGQKPDQGTIIYFDFTPSGDFIGKSREEVTGKDAFVVKKLKGSVAGKTVELRQFVADRKKEIAGVRWCNFEAILTYIDSTGYLEGTFRSGDCRGYSGKIICYRSEMGLSQEPTVVELQSWRPIFADDLKHGRKAPEIRNQERRNFRFQPIYFDHDKDVIREEFKPFLTSLVKVVNGHSDLRIKVVGHTDADGSDAYNVDLSRRRAQAIIDYFVAMGLAADRIQIEFRGESDPVGDNHTAEGKQLNRRVDFSFI